MSPLQNHLLAALPPAIQQRLFPMLELVPLPLGKVLYESGDTMRYVYFPTDSIVSLLYVMESGASAEISVVGKDGIVGVSLFMGGESTSSRAVVQSAGSAYCLAGQKLKDEFNRHSELMQLLLRYTQSLITQMAQTAVCNRHHSIDQQLCRWLLLSLDRLPDNKLTMTQELIANMLGAPRRCHRSGRQIAKNRRHRLLPWAYHRARPQQAGSPELRVLRGGQTGKRPFAAPAREQPDGNRKRLSRLQALRVLANRHTHLPYRTLQYRDGIGTRHAPMPGWICAAGQLNVTCQPTTGD